MTEWKITLHCYCQAAIGPARRRKWHNQFSPDLVNNDPVIDSLTLPAYERID